MLDNLIQYLYENDHDDNAFVALHALEILEDDLRVVIRVCSELGGPEWSKWTVYAKGILQYDIRDPHGDLEVYAGDHELLRTLTDPVQELTFLGRPGDATALVGALFSVHRRTVGDWIPFDRFLNPSMEIGELLSRGAGMVAKGPAFLLAAYDRALKEHGISSNLSEARPAKHWVGGHWELTSQKLAALVLGDSYFIAEAFEASSVSDDP